MAAAADYAHDTDPCTARLPFAEIKDVTVIIGMDPAVPPASAARAGLQLRAEGRHIILEPIF